MNKFKPYRQSFRNKTNKKSEVNVETEELEEELEEEVDRLEDFPDEGELEITEVEQLTRPRFHYRLSFGPLKLKVHEDVMIKFRMLKGYSFSKAALQEIVAANELQSAYSSAINYLSYRSRTRTEISRKLKEKEYDAYIIEATLERLQKENLIDDRLFATQWANQRVKTQKKGKVWIRQELRQKGIDQEDIEQVLGDIDSNDELDGATALARKKWNSTSGGLLDKKRKTMAYLMRRGYSGDVVKQALLSAEHQDEEDNE